MNSMQAGLSFHRYNGDGVEVEKGSAQLSCGRSASGRALRPRLPPTAAPPPLLANAISRPSHVERIGRLSRHLARATNHAVKWNCQTWSHSVHCELLPLHNKRVVICVNEVVRLIWKIGLYRHIMALARWAILVVGVNAELVYFAMFIEGLYTSF